LPLAATAATLATPTPVAAAAVEATAAPASAAALAAGEKCVRVHAPERTTGHHLHLYAWPHGQGLVRCRREQLLVQGQRRADVLPTY